jgi:hypothetical protein
MTMTAMTTMTIADLPAPPIRGVVLTGVAALALAASAFGTWAALAPLGSAVIAMGELSVETHR